jgi:hypothetical protein
VVVIRVADPVIGISKIGGHFKISEIWDPK